MLVLNSFIGFYKNAPTCKTTFALNFQHEIDGCRNISIKSMQKKKLFLSVKSHIFQTFQS